MDIEEQKLAVAEELGVVTTDRDPEEVIGQYRLLSENAIPIGKTAGQIYQQRYDDGMKAMAELHKDWRAAINEFVKTGAFTGDELTHSAPEENVIRTTVETLVDYSYMRNPTAEISGQDQASMPMAKMMTTALSTLMNKKNNLGINLRPKIIKQIMFAHFTNFGCLRLDFQPKTGSIEQVLETLEVVRTKIKEETDLEESNRLYELLDILQRELDQRKEFGLSVSVRNPFNIIVDDNTTELDLSDAKWLMERDFLDIAYIQAEYMKKDPETGQLIYRYDENVIYDPEAKENKEAITQEEIVDKLFPDMDEEQAKVRMKNKMPVVYVYDRVTRLVILYIEGRWETPLWVYEDEIGLSRFFRHFFLGFSTPLNSIAQKGEVTHYIDFQREINSINKQAARVRKAAFSIIMFNSESIDVKEVQKVLDEVHKNDGTLKAIGVKMKDKDKQLSDVMMPFKMPVSQFTELFDKTGLKAAVDAASRISDALRGQQFKTNTNKDAVATYNNQSQTRLEGLTDKIESSTEDLLWAICEVMMSKFNKQEMAMLLPAEQLQFFEPISVNDLNRQFAMIIAAGSTEKPTTQNKKNEAVSIIQMLGQFGSAAPGTVLSIVSRLLRSAFSRTLVSDEDLEMLKQESTAALQKGVSTPQQPPQAAPPQV